MHNVRLLNSTVYIIQSERGPGVLDRACEQLLAPGSGNLNNLIFKCSKPGGGGLSGKGGINWGVEVSN